METVDHILSKMREPSCFKGKIPVERVDADFREFANRLEAAIKREREAVGNAAKMREALEEINRIVWDKRRHTTEEVEAHRLATTALSAPARNCDLLADEQEAMTAIHNDRCCVQNPIDERRLTVKWLFAEAKGANDEQM